MFLANENFPNPSTKLLRENGVIIKSIQEDSSGIEDPEVMEIAINLGLIILTFDSDYGELIFKHAKDNPPSVIYFREKGTNPLFAGKVLLELLSNPDITFKNAFTVIEQNNIRQRFYKK